MEFSSGIFHATPPYDFGKFLRYIDTFPPTKNEHTATDRQFIKSFRQNGQTLAFQVKPYEDESDQIKLECAVISKDVLPDDQQELAIFRTRQFLGIDEDLSPFYSIAEQDEHFRPIVQQFHGHRLVKFITPFEAVAWCIFKRNLPSAQAYQTKKKLAERMEYLVNINGIVYKAFPEPEDILNASPYDLEFAISDQEVIDKLNRAAETVQQWDELSLYDESYEQVRNKLLDINGIDRKAAIYIMTHGFGKTREVDFSDGALQSAITKIYGGTHDLNADEVQSIADRYNDWKGYWAYYLQLSSLQG